MQWGPGGATAPDTNLYRSAAQILHTAGGFQADLGIASASGTANNILLSSDGKLYFGNLNDTSLFRDGAGIIRTDGQLHVKGGSGVDYKSTLLVGFYNVAEAFLQCGGVDSGGAGYRIVRIPN